MKEGWMKNDQGWRMKDDDFKLLRGFCDWLTDGQTNERTDICECRVAFATENTQKKGGGHKEKKTRLQNNLIGC